MRPSEEEFIAWSENPITLWVMRAARLNAEECKELWVRRSWDGCEANRELLIETRTRADANLSLCDTDYWGWVETHDKHR